MTLVPEFEKFSRTIGSTGHVLPSDHKRSQDWYHDRLVWKRMKS